MDKSPPDCPYCYGEREWSGTGVAACYFCGRSEQLRENSIVLSEDSELKRQGGKNDT